MKIFFPSNLISFENFLSNKNCFCLNEETDSFVGWLVELMLSVLCEYSNDDDDVAAISCAFVCVCSMGFLLSCCCRF